MKLRDMSDGAFVLLVDSINGARHARRPWITDGIMRAMAEEFQQIDESADAANTWPMGVL